MKRTKKLYRITSYVNAVEHFHWDYLPGLYGRTYLWEDYQPYITKTTDDYPSEHFMWFSGGAGAYSKIQNLIEQSGDMSFKFVSSDDNSSILTAGGTDEFKGESDTSFEKVMDVRFTLAVKRAVGEEARGVLGLLLPHISDPEEQLQLFSRIILDGGETPTHKIYTALALCNKGMGYQGLNAKTTYFASTAEKSVTLRWTITRLF